VATDIPDLVARVFDIGDIILSAAARTSEAIVIGARRSRGSMQLIIENLYVVEWPAISTSCVGLTGDKYLRTILSRSGAATMEATDISVLDNDCIDGRRGTVAVLHQNAICGLSPIGRQNKILNRDPADTVNREKCMQVAGAIR